MQVYDMVEAAEYLGLAPVTVKKYIYEGKLVPDQKLPKRLLFYETTLDTFARMYLVQPRGDPNDPTTVRAVAWHLGVRPETVAVWLRQGRLPGACKMGRRWVIPPDAKPREKPSGA